MAHKYEDDLMYLDIANRVAERSHDLTHRVGCVIVKDENILAYGWNGMPEGMDNCMEYPQMMRHECGSLYLKMRTRPEAAHAELNALSKIARSTSSALNASLYVTLSPCLKCALQIHKSGISEVVYDELYKDVAGVTFLAERGLTVRRFE
jgi:dCMP deaminase